MERELECKLLDSVRLGKGIFGIGTDNVTLHLNGGKELAPGVYQVFLHVQSTVAKVVSIADVN
jgi:hypothetical protein